MRRRRARSGAPPPPGGPTIAAAAAAGAGALLVLMLSPVPTVRGFGLLLVVGIAIALLCALVVGSAALALAGAGDGGAGEGGGRGGGVAGRAFAPARRLGAILAPSWRGAQELLRENFLTRFISGAALVYAVRNPGRVIGVGLALAALGWGLDTQTHVETNLEKLVPQNLASLRNLDALERASGVGGEIDLMVSGANTRHARDDRMDELLPERRPQALRLHLDSWLRQGAAVPGLLAAHALPGGRLAAGASATGSGSGAAAGGASHSKLTQAEVSGLLRDDPARTSPRT